MVHAGGTVVTPRRWQRLAAAAVAVAVAAAVAPRVLARAGTWLVVEDALAPSRAIVVLGGALPFRAMEAARIYKDGAAPEMWLTEAQPSDQDVALKRLGIAAPPEHAYSRMVVERLGVPAAAVHLLPDRIVNTADEVRAVAAELRRSGGERVILVTSKYHARRVKVLWRSLVGDHPSAIIRYSSDDPFMPERWWRTTHDGLSVTREWLGLMNAWLGFPIPATRSRG
jgi:uncharacterized SAM-binding protein YcdF (DUF218 family)